MVIMLVAGSIAWAAKWVLYPPPLDMRIEVEPLFSFVRYDDHAGNLPLGAVVRITNLSTTTAWFLGYPEAPVHDCRQLVGGEWQWHWSDVHVSTDPLPHWTPLRSMESLTAVVGPISEETTEMRVGLAFTTERLRPAEAHWVFSPAVKVVKRGQDYFAEPKPGAQQEEQVVSLRH